VTRSPDATPRIRAARRDDLGRVAELLELGSLVAGKEVPTDTAPYEAAWSEIATGPGGVLVAEVGGEVVGACQLIVFRHLGARGGRCAEIESVHVHPDHRGQGIGHALMRTAIEHARDLGCYRVQLTSNQARPEAHRFYESLGFTASHRGFKLALE
jgi:GNAT superfamily N-acetyltransferase